MMIQLPTDIPETMQQRASNLHSPPVRLVPRRTLRGGSAGGGLVRLFLPRHPKAAVIIFIQSTYKNRLSCGVASFSSKSTKEDPIDSCGVSDGLPPTRLASSRHSRRLSYDILFHRSSVVSRYRLLWHNRCRPVSHGPPPLLYQRVLVKYPYVEPELTAEVHRHPKMAAAKIEDLQRALAVCCIRCPCPYLHAWVIFHRYAVVSSLFLLFVFYIYFV